MELQLYQTVLYLAGGINVMIAFVLLHNNYWFRNYDIYHSARQYMAVNYIIFGIGFVIHSYFLLRLTHPIAASALSVSYFHSGGVLFGWSHTSLMRPGYLTKKVMVRDLCILVIGLAAYWTTMANGELQLMKYAFGIFFAHAVLITHIFYSTYISVRRTFKQMPADEKAPKWWTMEAKRKVLARHNSFVIGCHLIVLFGIGSIIVTACFQHEIWPYTILMSMGIGVFCFLFYSLAEYGNTIESATYAAEDAENKTEKPIEH